MTHWGSFNGLELAWIGAFLVVAGTLPGAAREAIIHPGRDQDPNPGPPGEPPYEMAGRLEERPPLVTFESVEGWEVEGLNGAEGWLYRTSEQRLYQREFCGKVVYQGRDEGSQFLVRPTAPLEIPGEWDCVNFWTYGNNWGWAPDPTTPPLHASLMVEDAAGRTVELGLGVMNYTYWFLMHARLPQAQRETFQFPARLVGFRFRNAGNTEKRSIYLGPAYFYTEELKPLTFDPWPEKLPFPTREETILPTNKAADFANTVHQDGDTVRFRYEGPEGELEYHYTPTDGTLGDIKVTWNGVTSFRPCAGGGLRLVGEAGPFSPTDGSIKRELRGWDLADDVLTVRWTLTAGEVKASLTYRFRLWAKSLVVDLEVGEPVVERVELGRAEGIREAQQFKVPYLTYGGPDPRVLFADGVYVFTQFDWFHSDASQLHGGPVEQGEGFARFNGWAEYIPKTDGTRNPVRERLFLTVSPDFHEVLPTVPNPPSPMRAAQANRLWRVKGGGNYAAEIAEAQKFREYGVDKVSIRYHEDTWRDAGESFTFRLEAAPGRGGDRALREFVRTVQSLGWRVGLYTNYTDFAPVNKHWNEDWVSRLPNGDWQRAWMRCYAPKPMRAVEAEAYFAPRIHEKFGENHSYCDVHTAVTPFQRVDYDARVPGAGMFRQTFLCFGRLLYNEKFAHHGPVFSEGRNHWWYAGLTDGNYAQIISGKPSAEPLLVDFDLLKLHPLEMDAGMGSAGMFRADSLEQFIAATVAYGHIGFLDSQWGWPAALKIYYLLQELQQRYAMIPVASIEYEHEGKLLNTSRALPVGAHRRGRLRVVYENGLEVWINGNDGPSWTVELGGEAVELPAWGFAAQREGDPLEVRSAILPRTGEGHPLGPRSRIEYARGDRYAYADTRGKFAWVGVLAAEGAVAVKQEEDGSWWAIPATDCADVGVRPEFLGLQAGAGIEVEAVGENGGEAGTPTQRWSQGYYHLLTRDSRALKFRLRPSERPAPPALTPDSRLVVPGQSLTVPWPEGLPVRVGGVEWELPDGSRHPAAAEEENGTLRLTAPAALPEGAHVWLRIPTEPEDLWLDFLSVAAFELTFAAPTETYLEQGEALPISLQVLNRQDTKERSQLQFGGEDLDCQPAEVDLTIPARGQAATAVEVTLPFRNGEYTLRADVGPGRHFLPAEDRLRAEAQLALHAEVVRAPVLDLTDSAVPYVRGYCRRGGEEVPGGEGNEDGSFEPAMGSAGGVNRRCLFSHPPYGARGPGYSFAIYDLALPDEPVSFNFALGLRDGLDPSDGVTFIVQVIDDAGEMKELFRQHYAEVRWQDFSVDLSAFQGQQVQLKLLADCGPADDTTADHGLWGEARVVSQQEKLRVKSP